MLPWELASGRIAGKCAKVLPGLGFEDMNAHRLDPFCSLTIYNPPSIGPAQGTRADGPARAGMLMIMLPDQPFEPRWLKWRGALA